MFQHHQLFLLLHHPLLRRKRFAGTVKSLVISFLSAIACNQNKLHGQVIKPQETFFKGPSQLLLLLLPLKDQLLLPHIVLSDLENLVKHMANIIGSSNVLSTTSSNPTPWYYDFGCCNHMTSINAFFSAKLKFPLFPYYAPQIIPLCQSVISVMYIILS